MLFVYIFPLILSALLGLSLAVFIARNRLAPGSRALTGLALGASLWSAGYCLEFLAPSLDAKLFWAKFQYIGITTIPAAWLIFAVQYLGTPTWLARSRKNLLTLWVIPLITLILVWTNELHGLVWQTVQRLNIGSVQMLELHYGAWFWVYWIYAYCLMLLGTYRLVRGLLASVRLYHWQITLAVLASSLPWIGNLLYVLGLSPVEHLDLTPFAFTLAGLLFTLSLFHFQLVSLLPIAQRTVFAGLADCLLVLDLQDCIADMNPAAQKMIPSPVKQPFGKPLAEVLPQLAQWIEPAGYQEEFRTEISCGEAPEQQYFELTVTPLSSPYPRTVGRLVVCHEITQHKQQQVQLEQARAHLETVVLERTEELRQTVEQLQLELTQRTLAERRFEEMVEAAPDAMLLVDQHGSIMLVNAQAEQLFGYTREELLGQNIETLVPVDRRRKHERHIRKYAAHPVVRQVSFDLDLSAQRKDGSQIPVEISLGPLATAEGPWVACSVRDISERKSAEQEQERLMEEIKGSRDELRALTYRLQEVQEFERRQIATELHDRVGQNLTGLNLNLQIIEDQVSPDGNSALRGRLEDSLQLLEETTRQVRDVMAELRPPMLDEFGLVSALNWYSERFSLRTGIATRVIGEELEPRLPPNDEMVLFRITQEALNNAARHSNANEVLIVLESSVEAACLIVKDNGRGFDPRNSGVPTRQPHWGLVNIEQRAASIGGQLAVDSAPGRGTQVSITLRRSQDEG